MKVRLHYGWVVAFAGMLVTVGSHGFGRMSYTLILPAMKEGLGLSYAQAGLLGTANFIGYVASALVAGFLATRYDSRRIIGLALAVMGVTMVLTGMAGSFAWAFAMRLVTGLGNGAAYVPTLALGSIWFAARRRGLATGIISAGVGLGTMAGALMVPPILSAYGPRGWSAAWFWVGALVVAISVVCYALLRSRPQEMGLEPVGSPVEPEPPSTFGEQLAPARSPSGQPAGPDRPGEQPAARAQPPRRAALPDSAGSRLPGTLVYRSPAVWHLGLVYFLYGFSYVIYLTFFAAYLTSERTWSAERASALWALVGGLSIFCGVLWGWVSDRLGRRQGAALVYLTLAAAYLLFALSRSSTGLYLSAIVFGLSAWSIPTIMAAASGDYVGAELAPAGLGFITLFFGIGQAIGPYVGGYLADVAGSFSWAFGLSAAVSLLGAAGALVLRRPEPEAAALRRGPAIPAAGPRR